MGQIALNALYLLTHCIHSDRSWMHNSTILPGAYNYAATVPPGQPPSFNQSPSTSRNLPPPPSYEVATTPADITKTECLLDFF